MHLAETVMDPSESFKSWIYIFLWHMFRYVIATGGHWSPVLRCSSSIKIQSYRFMKLWRRCNGISSPADLTSQWLQLYKCTIQWCMCLCILYTTFLSGQLYLAKIASYVSTAPSVTSIMAWLHSLPLPVSLNWKEKETERELTAQLPLIWKKGLYIILHTLSSTGLENEMPLISGES